MESSLPQGGEEPVGWVTAVEHQEVVVAEFVEVFEEHLALADVGRIELGGQGHFDPGQIEREAFGLDHVADEALAVTGLAEQGQAQDRGIAGNDAQPVPERKAELRIDQGEEMIVEKPKAVADTCFRAWAKACAETSRSQVGAVRQIGEERVQFRLHFGRVSAEQAGDQAGKTEEAGSGESLLRQTRLNEKSLRKKEVRERVNDIDIKILAYKILPGYQGDSDLIRLGRAHKPALTDDEAARSEGANQFKVAFDQLKQALSKNEWVKKNILIAVAGGEKDGTSGLRDATASFAAQRKNVEGLAHIVFSANPKQIRFWLGKESASVEELESQYNGRKPCLHGSDAHSLAKAGQPDGDRRCWIKGDLTFDSLRQTCIEPEERVFIGAEPPRGALDSHTINSVAVTNAPWIRNDAVELNAGLVAVIGARGSGKTALADLIAAGGFALSPHLNERSFILRAKRYLGDSEAKLQWASGEETGNKLDQPTWRTCWPALMSSTCRSSSSINSARQKA
jgi:hypothetical protein